MQQLSKKRSMLMSESRIRIVLGVSYEVDDLAIGASELEYFSETQTYTYEKTGADHDLSFGSQLTGGSVTLRIKNASGSQIYSKTFSSIAGESVTVSDASSPWTIEFEYTNASGSLGFSLDKIQ